MKAYSLLGNLSHDYYIELQAGAYRTGPELGEILHKGITVVGSDAFDAL